MTAAKITAAFVVIAALASCSVLIGLHGEPTLDASVGADASGVDAPSGDAEAGAPQPVALATGLAGPFMLAQWGPNLYWTDDIANQIGRADKVDGSPAILGQHEDFPFGIAVDDSGVYFSNAGGSGSIGYCPFTGCPGPDLFDYGNPPLTDVAAALGWVYWIHTGQNEIDRIAETDDSGIPTFVTGAVVNTSDLYLNRIATDGTTLWWTETLSGRVRRTVIGSGVGANVFSLSASSRPSAVHPDNGVLYVATLGAGGAGQGAIVYGPADGSGSATTLADNQNGPYTIATDATYVYWTTAGYPAADGGALPNSGVYRCAKTGCNDAPDVLASGLLVATGIVVDDVAIYFTTNGSGNKDGAVWRLAKPP